MDNPEVRIEKIGSKSPYLDAVKKLWRANAKTLGFFSNDAFDDYAKSEQILIALNEEDNFLGYLIYYANRSKIIKIQHLCTTNEAQGRGIAKLLVEHLKQITRDFLDIRLVCRQDYGIDSMWEKFGFTPMHEKQGKSKQGYLVTTWVYNHGHQDLFSIRVDHSQATKLHVVIDACIFLDLYSASSQSLEESESACLLADWVQSELELCVSDEVYTEISRHPDKKIRDKIRAFADGFLRLNCSSQLVESIQKEIIVLFKDNDAQNISDITIRQLARVIASEQSSFLVTTNVDLLAFAKKINEQYGVFIVSPNKLIVKLSELRTASEYQPAQLAGTRLFQRKVNLEDHKILKEAFFANDEDSFENKFKKILIKTEIYECFTVWEDNIPIALFAYDRSKNHELSIPFLRVKYRSLSETLARHIIYRTIILSANEGRYFTKISEMQMEEFIVRAVQDAGFSSTQNNWLKVNLKTISSTIDLSDALLSISSNLGEEYNKFCGLIANNLRSAESSDIEYISELEKFLYPAKICDYDIPNFIIPIKPTWAKDLFDEGLAKQNFFGAERSELALNWEAVYYRNKKLPSNKFKSPARILWYISEDKDGGYTQTSSIRACSTLDEVIIGNPEELYLKFQRLGIYKWTDIKKLSGEKANNKIMAVRFSNTELFETPISLRTIHEILGTKAQFQSPRFISSEKFFQIYSIGCSTSV
jgi:predicted GNAT family acetyltransferase